MSDLYAHLYPNPTDSPLPYSDMIEIVSADDEVITNDCETRDHPEVPLTTARRDQAVKRLGYSRTGPWQDEDDGRATAPVAPLIKADE